MKKKLIILIVVGLLILSGVVHAASLWGTYKGYDIIRLTVNGESVKVSDVPAMNFNSRTMIPIYLLSQAGITYNWDFENKTVNIVPPTSPEYIKLWAYVAKYYSKLDSISAEFYIRAQNVNLFGAAINGNANTESLEKYYISNSTRIDELENEFENLVAEYDKDVRKSFDSMNYSPAKLNSIEKNYRDAISNLKYALSSLKSYYNSNKQVYFDETMKYMYAANDNIVLAQQSSQSEFDYFQNGIINGH